MTGMTDKEFDATIRLAKKILRLAEHLNGGLTGGIESGGQGRDKADMRPGRDFKEGDSVRITTRGDLTGTITACNVPGRIYTVDTINGTMVCKRRDLSRLNQINNRNMKELNLCEIIKGHEEDVFYSPMWGDTYVAIFPGNGAICIMSADDTKMRLNIHPDGKYENGGECLLFPSRDQRDWNKWIEQHEKITYTDILNKMINNGCTIESIALTCASSEQSDKIHAINKLMNVQKWIEKGWQPDWEDRNQDKFYVYIDGYKKLRIDLRHYINGAPVYFSSEANAQKAIEILGEDVIRQALSTDW